MKKMMKHFALLALVLFYTCSNEQLDVVNPNSPTFDAINTETGTFQLAAGTYSAMHDGAWFTWIVLAYHEAMSDAIYIPWGNWSFRWTNQPTSITLDDGTVVTPPQEGAQGDALEVRNVRTLGRDNAFFNEWRAMYNLNNQTNLLLDLIPNVEFTGDAATKQSVLSAWAHFWKGIAYSRIGSMYTAGLIVDESGTTNGDFVSNTEILAEAERNFDISKTLLEGISADITSITASLVPDNLVASPFRGSASSGVLTRDAWIRNINTLLARNILVNTKVADMTPAQWTEVTNLTNEGIRPTDFVFVMKQDGNNFNTTANVPIRVTQVFGWHFVSERLVQDFKAGDARFTDNIELLGAARVNQSGRGIQYGTRYGFITNADYGITEDTKANIYFGSSYDENALMQAEALIYSGQIDAGLDIVDAVRTHQQANLPAVSGTGLTEAEALEELRIERRIGLLLRGVGFYDARRWDVTKTPRPGLTVLDALGNVNTNATFDYNYLDYWSVPDQEIVFNEPNEGSFPVTSPN